MEELDGLVQRRAVDDRVVRGERHPQDVGVLVLERAGQVVVDLVEAERQRLVDRARAPGPPVAAAPRRPASRSIAPATVAPAPGTPAAAGRSSASSTNGETRRRGPRRSRRHATGSARPGRGSSRHSRADAPRPAPTRGRPACRVPGRPAAAGSRHGRSTGTGRRPCRAGRPRGTRGPSPCGRSGRPTASRSGIEVRGGRVVPGLDEGLEVTRHEDRAVVGEDRRLGPDEQARN